MADDDEKENENSDEDKDASGGGKKKIILLAIIGLVLIGVSVGGTLAALSFLGGDEEMAAEGEDVDAEVMDEPMKQAIYYPIKPPLMTSFDARGRQRLVQAEVTLMTRDSDVIAAVELHMPMIRNALVLLISGQIYEEIQTAEGKELLRVQSLQELQRLLEQEIGKPGIEEVLFTGLILQ